MARPGISSLRMPPDKFRLDLHMPGFETIQDAQDEDFRRANALPDDTDAPIDGVLDNRSDKLFRMLKKSASGVPAITPASKLFMRDYRIRTYGHLWRLVEGSKEPVSTFTWIPRCLVRFPEDLDDLDPAATKHWMRTVLNRCGAGDSSGFLYASLDGEFMPHLRSYQVHFHGIASGGKIQAIDRLRALDSFAPWELSGRVRGCRKPVQISRAPLTDLPASIAYADKGFWQAKIHGRSRRVPEPYHSQVLLMLNKHRIEDLTMLMNLKVLRGDLVVSK